MLSYHIIASFTGVWINVTSCTVLMGIPPSAVTELITATPAGLLVTVVFVGKTRNGKQRGIEREKIRNERKKNQ